MSSFIAKLQKRLRSEESGFTLIELLIVLVIIGILLAIAVPSYLGFKQRAQKTAAQANIRAAIPSAEAYYADNGNYTALNEAALRSIDSGLVTRRHVDRHTGRDLIHAPVGGRQRVHGIGDQADARNDLYDRLLIQQPDGTAEGARETAPPLRF